MMEKSATWTFVLVAAGSGSRMGGTPKQFRPLGADPMWRWSLRVAEGLYMEGRINEVVVVFPSDYGVLPDADRFPGSIHFVYGGDTRTESVKNGVRSATGDYVLVHDAARPFLSRELCLELMERTKDEVGAVPLLPSVDSLQRMDAGVSGAHGRISVLPRESVYRTQTPQAFHRQTLLTVLDSTKEGTDEASLWLASGRELTSVAGEERCFKITTEWDWLVARSLVEAGRETRTGLGYDVHELVPGRRLILGGVEVASPLGLLGHSDADVICHAIADAMLGAAGEGDIGTLFPASESTYKNADSMRLLCHVYNLISAKGWHLRWLDVTLAAQVPRLAHLTLKISKNLTKLFTIDEKNAKLNFKVKSGEYVGSIGRADCMVCYAAATLERYQM